MHDVEIGFAFLERFWAKGYAYKNSLGQKRIVATTVEICQVLPVLGKKPPA
jgi:hypothetical protein